MAPRTLQRKIPSNSEFFGPEGRGLVALIAWATLTLSGEGSDDHESHESAPPCAFQTPV